MEYAYYDDMQGKLLYDDNFKFHNLTTVHTYALWAHIRDSEHVSLLEMNRESSALLFFAWTGILPSSRTCCECGCALERVEWRDSRSEWGAGIPFQFKGHAGGATCGV